MTEDFLNLEKKSRLEKRALKITQLEQQKRAIRLRENQKARKARVRRLIQIGILLFCLVSICYFLTFFNMV